MYVKNCAAFPVYPPEDEHLFSLLGLIRDSGPVVGPPSINIKVNAMTFPLRESVSSPRTSK